MSRTEKTLINIRFALVFQAASIVVSFLTRKVFVQVLTQEYLGLDGAFANILSVLSLTEMGIGSAITYSLYKPLAENDREQIVSLMGLYHMAYRVIAVIVALAGCALTPFLPMLIHDLPDIPNISLIYLLFILNTVLSYFCAYKQSLIIADQRQYITTACRYGFKILLLFTQAVFLLLTRNYFIYLGLQIGATLLENLVLSRLTGRLYPYIINTHPKALREKTKQEILRNTKAMLIHKIGATVVFSTDNLLISFFFGVEPVGIYSNYLMITNGLKTVYEYVIRNALPASIGNLHVTESWERVVNVFWKINLLGNWIYGFSCVCLIILFNPFISLWVGSDYLFSQEIVCLLALNFYINGMRQVTLAFREAYGLYWHDRHKSIAEALINIIASVTLAVPFGVAGIFVGTSICLLATCFWIEPIILFKHGLHTSPKPFFKDYAINSLITLITVIISWHFCSVLPGTGIKLFLEKLLVCLVLGNAGYLAVYCWRKEFWYFIELLCKTINRMLRR